MADWIQYLNFWIVDPEPTAEGGKKLNENFTLTADLLASKLPLDGGTMNGPIYMGPNSLSFDGGTIINDPNTYAGHTAIALISNEGGAVFSLGLDGTGNRAMSMFGTSINLGQGKGKGNENPDGSGAKINLEGGQLNLNDGSGTNGGSINCDGGNIYNAVFPNDTTFNGTIIGHRISFDGDDSSIAINVAGDLEIDGVNNIQLGSPVILSSGISGNGSGLTALNASNLSSGKVAVARLGTGTATSSTWLRGDGAWTAVPFAVPTLDQVATAGHQTGIQLSLNGGIALNNQAIDLGSGAQIYCDGDVLSLSFAQISTEGNPLLVQAEAKVNSLNLYDGANDAYGAVILSDSEMHFFNDEAQTIYAFMHADGIGLNTIDVASNGRIQLGNTSTFSTGSGSSFAVNGQTPKTAQSGDVATGLVAYGFFNGGASYNATSLTGTVNTARLGSGTANTTTFLRGDNSWQAIPTPTTISGTVTESQVVNLTSDLALKAPLASPTLTGTATIGSAATLAFANPVSTLSTASTLMSGDGWSITGRVGDSQATNTHRTSLLFNCWTVDFSGVSNVNMPATMNYPSGISWGNGTTGETHNFTSYTYYMGGTNPIMIAGSNGGNTQVGAGDNKFITLKNSAAHTQTSGTNATVQVIPTYNQTGATSIINTDLLINRTETSLGTTPGIQKLLDMQVGGTSKTYFKNDGVFFPVQAVTASAPTYVKGGVYFDTTLNKLRIGGATAWETVTST